MTKEDQKKMLACVQRLWTVAFQAAVPGDVHAECQQIRDYLRQAIEGLSSLEEETEDAGKTG